MPVMDEFKESRQALKKKSFKEKIQYFWYYYKTQTLVTLFLVVLATATIIDIVNQKDNAFFALLLNSSVIDEEKADSLAQDYMAYAEIDTDKYNVALDTSINFTATAEDILTGMGAMNASASERLLVYTASGETDVIMASSPIFLNQAFQGMFHDLRDILSEEQIAKYEPYFYYIDQVYVDALTEAQNSLSYGEQLDESLAVTPDPTKPEEMEQPIPVGLFTTDCSTLTDAYWFGEGSSVMGVMVNAPHLEDSLEFIDYLFE